MKPQPLTLYAESSTNGTSFFTVTDTRLFQIAITNPTPADLRAAMIEQYPQYKQVELSVHPVAGNRWRVDYLPSGE